jgi:hypothetical protein
MKAIKALTFTLLFSPPKADLAELISFLGNQGFSHSLSNCVALVHILKTVQSTPFFDGVQGKNGSQLTKKRRTFESVLTHQHLEQESEDEKKEKTEKQIKRT